MWSHSYLLFLQDITAVFDGFTALDVKDLGVLHNELRVVVGPNGAGKSTMCDVISGLTKPATGSVFFDGQEITGQDVAISLVVVLVVSFKFPTFLILYRSGIICAWRFHRHGQTRARLLKLLIALIHVSVARLALAVSRLAGHAQRWWSINWRN